MCRYLITGIVVFIGLMTGWLSGNSINAALAHKWQAPAKDAAIANPVAMDDASIQRGRKIYWKSCLMCHGPEARGNGLAARSLDPKPADLTKSIKMHSDGDFYWKIMTGRLPMPGFTGQLKPPQVWDVINYIKSLKK